MLFLALETGDPHPLTNEWKGKTEGMPFKKRRSRKLLTDARRTSEKVLLSSNF